MKSEKPLQGTYKGPACLQRLSIYTNRKIFDA